MQAIAELELGLSGNCSSMCSAQMHFGWHLSTCLLACLACLKGSYSLTMTSSIGSSTGLSLACLVVVETHVCGGLHDMMVNTLMPFAHVR